MRIASDHKNVNNMVRESSRSECNMLREQTGNSKMNGNSLLMVGAVQKIKDRVRECVSWESSSLITVK